jgi:glycosyltransferase involved in cell wall biosynthesis
MISVIIPIYNQADKLPLCLDSLLAQTYNDIEVIVVNDGSKDDSLAQAKQYINIFKNQDIPYKVLTQTNQGAPAARNKGWKEARGEYLLFCDADACLEPEALMEMLNILREHPGISFVYSNFQWGRKHFKLCPFSKEKLRKMPYIHTMSLIRRKDFPSRGWDESIKKFQDWDLWLTMAEQGHKGYWLDKTLFRIQTGGVYSSWLPKIAYKLFPFLPQVKKYKQAMSIIKNKHRIGS